MRFDLLIKNGNVIKGFNSSDVPEIADIAVNGDRIAEIGNLRDSHADVIIDAKGFCVTPGFIDVHSHSEFTLLADGRAEGKISQGITTEINGNCGLSAAPMRGSAREQREDELRSLGIGERWTSFNEYYALLHERGIALNVSTLVGHNSLRASAMGYAEREPTQSEMEQLEDDLKASFRAGARGLSTGLIYPPGIFSGLREITRLAQITASLGGVYTTHMRNEGDTLIEAVDETLKIARASGIHAHISHLKISGKKNWHKLNTLLDKLKKAIESGLSLSCDRYPYIAGSTDLDVLLPSWAFEGGREEELRSIREQRERVMRDIRKTCPHANQWQDIIISSVRSVRNKWMEGRKISDIAEVRRRSPIDLVCDILLEEELAVGAIFFSMNEKNLKAVLSLPYCMIGTDSAARSFDGVTAVGKPHPRGYGSFPRMLGTYVRDANLMAIGSAIYKITGLPARVFRLHGRGSISKGFYADIVVFDPVKIHDRANYEYPFCRSEGISHVIINGIPVLREERITGALPGRILQ